jgi:hypothetical protein
MNQCDHDGLLAVIVCIFLRFVGCFGWAVAPSRKPLLRVQLKLWLLVNARLMVHGCVLRNVWDDFCTAVAAINETLVASESQFES